MAEPQLVDYIKKARDAGQDDQQTKSLLMKNGWTDAEVSDAFSIAVQAKVQPQPQPSQPQYQRPQQSQPSYQPTQQRPQPAAQPAAQSYAASQPSYQSAKTSAAASRSSSHSILGPMLAIILLLLIAGGLFYALYSGIYNPSWNPFSQQTVQTMQPPVDNSADTQPNQDQNTAPAQPTVAPEVQQVHDDLSAIGLMASSVLNADKSYSSLCFKGLLNGYDKTAGDNLIKMNNDIVAQGASKPTCYASATNFCVSTQLADGSYSCVGVQAGTLGSVPCTGADTVCQ